MKGRQPCKICGAPAVGTWFDIDDQMMLLCEEHLGMLANNKRGIRERIGGFFRHRGGSMKGEHTPMPRWAIFYSGIVIIGWFLALVFGLILMNARGTPSKIIGGWIGQIMIIFGFALLVAVLWGKKEFWDDWIVTGRWGGRRMYYFQLILSVVLVVLPFILWMLGIIWLPRVDFSVILRG